MARPTPLRAERRGAVPAVLAGLALLGACNLDPGKEPWDPPAAAARP